MNQTQKRLSIINLAISITDNETIQLQIGKLRLLQNDRRIKEIVSALEAHNYAYSQKLINDYIQTPTQHVHQRTLQNSYSMTNEAFFNEEPQKFEDNEPVKYGQERYTPKERELIKQFDLFVNDNVNPQNNSVDYSKVSGEKPKNAYDVLLDMSADEIMPDNIKIDLKGDAFFESEDAKTPKDFAVETVPKDTFFDEKSEEEEEMSQPSSSLQYDMLDEDAEEREEVSEELDSVEEAEEFEDSDESALEEDASMDPSSLEYENRRYPPILSIREQFEEAINRYQPLEESEEVFSTVNAWLKQISTEGYQESEIREIVKRILTLAESEDQSHRAEAVELLLITGITEDMFAQLILSRELYRGRLLTKDVDASFKIMDRLAEQEYPEAVCDLAQFLEYGIGTKKDKKKAKSLYLKAMDMGVERAQKHYEKLKKEGGIFSF